MFEQWATTLRVTWDENQFSKADVINLIDLAGHLCGIGAFRPDEPLGRNMDFGRFEVEL
jgi:hypothetical protein